MKKKKSCATLQKKIKSNIKSRVKNKAPWFMCEGKKSHIEIIKESRTI